MPAPKRGSSRDAWIVAWALALVLHVLAIAGFHRFPLIGRVSTPKPAEPAPIQLVFSPPTPAATATKDEKPHFFSELPPDRKDVAPKKADFLSNVTSRARDNVGGGNTDLPRMKGEGDAPMVALEPNGGPTHPPTSAAAPAPPTPPSPPAQTPRPSATSPGANPAPTASFSSQIKVGGPTAPAQNNNAGPTAQAPTDQGSLFGYGHSDMRQPEMNNPEGQAALTGDVSLNTTQWEYAPWLQRFGRRLMQTWYAPPAYYMGILKDGGWAVVEIEIDRSGQLLRLDLLEQQGHPTLIRAATMALQAMAPMERLPSDFPEKTLVLRIRMIYPKIRR